MFCHKKKLKDKMWNRKLNYWYRNLKNNINKYETIFNTIVISNYILEFA